MTVYYKTRQMLLQNARAILLENVTEVYKMQQLLQNATILLQNATVIMKCNVYYKLRQDTMKEKGLRKM